MDSSDLHEPSFLNPLPKCRGQPAPCYPPYEPQKELNSAPSTRRLLARATVACDGRGPCEAEVEVNRLFFPKGHTPALPYEYRFGAQRNAGFFVLAPRLFAASSSACSDPSRLAGLIQV